MEINGDYPLAHKTDLAIINGDQQEVETWPTDHKTFRYFSYLSHGGTGFRNLLWHLVSKHSKLTTNFARTHLNGDWREIGLVIKEINVRK